MTFSKLSLFALVIPGLAIAFFAGRASVSPPAEYREHVAEKLQAREEAKTNLNTTKTVGPTERVVYRERTVTVPGGTITVERWHTAEKAAEIVTKAEEQTVLIREVEVEKIRDVVRVSRPQWRVSLMPGYSLANPLVGVPGASGFVVGASLERHIMGPFSAGAWASSFGAAGVSLGVSW